jgi:putative ABC transport system substrate-binding protein
LSIADFRFSIGAASIFVAALALSLVVAPLTADAQQAGKVVRIGVLANTPPTTPEVARNWEAFRHGLGEHGWVEGQNLVIEYRWAAGQVERFPSLAEEVVSLKPDLIVAASTHGARAAKQATSAIPTVMIYVSDPIGEGLIASLARPGGNITGPAFGVGQEIVGKLLELIKEAVPAVARVGVLLYPDASSAAYLRSTQVAGQVLGVKLHVVEVQRPTELEGAFAAMTRERVGAFLALPHPFTYTHARRIAELAAKSQLPSVYPYREYVEAGGLMAYGANAPDMFRHAATYVDKILKGAKPGDLPVEQPTKFQLVINPKAATALGLTIPQSILVRADEVIP